MWYAFWPEAVSTEEKFMSQMDALVREVDDRGKVTTQLSEGVPPFVAQLSEAPAAFERAARHATPPGQLAGCGGYPIFVRAFRLFTQFAYVSS